MAFCANCGTQLNEGAKFCASCGTPAGGAAPAQPAAEKVGNIRKCPACGAQVPAMSALCPSCGHEFSNVQVTNSVQAFFAKLDAIDSEIYANESAQQAKGPSSMGSGFLGAVFSTAHDSSSKYALADAGLKRKIAMIEGYPIPNSKEDILEFVLLASSRYKGLKKPFLLEVDKEEEFKLDSAWKAKCEQAYGKAKMTMGSDKEAIANIEGILKEKKIIK